MNEAIALTNLAAQAHSLAGLLRRAKLYVEHPTTQCFPDLQASKALVRDIDAALAAPLFPAHEYVPALAQLLRRARMYVEHPSTLCFPDVQANRALAREVHEALSAC